MVYGVTKQEVQEKLRLLQNDAANGRLADAGAMTVKEWLTTWLETARSNVQPKTHLRYEQLVRLRINPHLGGASWRSWRRSTSSSFLRRWNAAGCRRAVGRWPEPFCTRRCGTRCGCT